MKKNAAVAVKPEVIVEQLKARSTKTPEGITVIEGDVNLSNKKLESLNFLKEAFGDYKVNGKFVVSYNSLRSLVGSPIEVAKDFKASYNLIDSEEGKPSIVGGRIKLDHNKIGKVAKVKVVKVAAVTVPDIKTPAKEKAVAAVEGIEVPVVSEKKAKASAKPVAKKAEKKAKVSAKPVEKAEAKEVAVAEIKA